MAGVIDELLVGLGFDYDPKELESFNKGMDSAISAVKNMAKVAIAGTAALVGFAAVTTSATDKQGKLSKQTGVAVGEIDALEFALKRAGGQSESMGANLSSLATSISQASRGVGGGIEAFGILGISVTDANGQLKETDQVMLEVADSLQQFSKAEQLDLAGQLGLGDSILLLQEGSSGIRKLTDEARALGVTTKEDAKLSEDFQDSLADIFQIGKQFSRELTRNLVPVMQEVATTMTDWWIQNKNIIEQSIPKFIDKIVLGFKLLSLAALAFIGIRLISSLGSLIALFKTLSIRALFASLAMAAIPLLIFAVATAIGLLAEDAMVFFEGGESFIGSMLQKFPEWSDQIGAVASIFATLAEITGMIFSGWGEIFTLFTSGNVIEEFLLVMRQAGQDIADFFSDLWDDVTSALVDKLEGAISSITAFIPFIGGDGEDKAKAKAPEDVSAGADFLSNVIASPSEQSAAISNDVTNSNMSNETKVVLGDINVTVAGDTADGKSTGKAIGQTIQKELEPMLKQASIDLNSAVIL